MAVKIEKNSFGGGYRFRPFAGQPEAGIDVLPIPQRVRLTRPEVLQPVVTKGQPVKAGQIVARSDESVSNPVIATISGTVETVGDGEIVVVSDGNPDWEPISGHTADWQNLQTGLLEEILYQGGLTALAPNGIPTRLASAPVGPADIEHVIVHHIQDEPYSPVLETLLGDSGKTSVKEGLEILGRIMTRATIHLVVDRRHRDLLSSFSTTTVRLHTVADKYPQSRQEVLVPTVLGQPFPNGYDAINMGVLLLDLQSVIQVRDAVVLGKPAIERVIALCGPGFTTNRHIRVRIGSPLSTIAGRLQDAPTRVIADSLLVGPTLKEDGVIPTTCRQLVAISEDARELVAWAQPGFKKDSISRTFAANFLPIQRSIDANLHGEHRPCIVCNFCDEVCPAGILPHVLHRYVIANRIDESLARYRVSDCIDCNLCTYVCPSKIPVAALMAEGKRKVLEEGLVSMERIRHRFALKGLAADQPEAEL